MKFTPEDLQKIETKKLANIIRKLNDGKTLTAREDRILTEAKLAGVDGVQTSVAANYATTWDELAKNLGVTRRSLQTWRIDEKLGPQCPPNRADGRKDIHAWLQFMVDHGLKRADEEIPDEDGMSTRDWKNERERLMCVRLQRDIDRDDGRLIVANDLEPDLGATFMAFQNRFSQLPERAAPRLVGFEDVYEIEDRLRDDVDRDLRELNSAGFLEESLREIIDSLPFDEETDKLFSLVCFAGQDREALLELIARVARATLQGIGRRCIGQITTATDVSAIEPSTPPAPEEKAQPASSKSASVAKRSGATKKPLKKSRKSTTRRKA